MIKRFFTLLATMALVSTPLSAAVARTYPDALSKTGNNPIVIFIYGANYDNVSKAAYETFVKKNKIAPYVRQATFLEMPIYQLPNDKEKKDMEKRLGGKRLPGGIWSYPCLAVVDAKGNLRGVVQGPEQMKDPETALEYLKVLVDDFIKQEKILTRARKAKGDKKAELLLEAADIDIRMPNDVLSKEEKQNLNDDTGLGNRIGFDPLSLVESLQIMSYDRANAHVRHLMAQGGYSKLQRQMMMAAYAGHLRRGGEGMTPASKERLRALYTEMRNIDPKSTYGAYAEGALVIWVEGGTLTDEPIPTEINRVGNTPDDGNSSGFGSGSDDDLDGKTALGDTVAPAVDEEPSDADFEGEGDDF